MDENINEILDLYYEKYPDAVDFVTMPDYYEKTNNYNRCNGSNC